MCWSEGATLAMIGLGGAATVITARRGEPAAIPATLGYFTLMEALQFAGYRTLDQCGTPANQAVTLLSYLHIAVQPIFINAFAMAVAPQAVPPRQQRLVLALAALATAFLVLRLVPMGWAEDWAGDWAGSWAGTCRPGDVLCGPALCTRSGDWHLAWEVPLNNPWSFLPGFTGLSGLTGLTGGFVQFPAYMLAVFVLPLFYGAWRFVLFHLTFGPLLAAALTGDPNEMPAVWCLFSIVLLLVALSPAIRTRLLGSPAPA